MDLAALLASRLRNLENQLAYVVSLHLFAENLIDRLIAAKSPLPKRILDDHRTYSFAVKLMLVLHLGLIEGDLFANIDALNWLRNRYGHDLDVDLGACVVEKESKLKRLQREGGALVFPDPAGTQRALEVGGPQASLDLLEELRAVTFGRLHAICVRLKIDLDHPA